MRDRLLCQATMGAAVLLLISAACACSRARPEANLHGVLWMQHAAEYRALVEQTYAAARRSLDLGLADPEWQALGVRGVDSSTQTPAVILDVDETVLSNGPYQAWLLTEGVEFSKDSWAQWSKAKEATAVPGALEFCQYAESRGVALFYITNRDVSLRDATCDNLRALGFVVDSDCDHVIGRDASSDKQPRREAVASNYRVLLLVGDDLNDFITSSAPDLDEEERERLVRENQELWGSKWFILPNPVYGGWLRAMTQGDDSAQARWRALEPWSP